MTGNKEHHIKVIKELFPQENIVISNVIGDPNPKLKGEIANPQL